MFMQTLLTITEVADELALSRSTIYELVASGRLETVRIGRARRVPRAALDAFVEGLRSVDD
jgi:excisionase family DNA binding protein